MRIYEIWHKICNLCLSDCNDSVHSLFENKGIPDLKAKVIPGIFAIPCKFKKKNEKKKGKREMKAREAMMPQGKSTSVVPMRAVDGGMPLIGVLPASARVSRKGIGVTGERTARGCD